MRVMVMGGVLLGLLLMGWAGWLEDGDERKMGGGERGAGRERLKYTNGGLERVREGEGGRQRGGE